MIARALCKAFPGQQWTFNHRETGYAGLHWIGPGPKPTQAQFEAALASYVDVPPQSKLDLVIEALERKGVLTKDDVRKK